MTLFRHHRGGFNESMDSVVQVKDFQGLCKIVRKDYGEGSVTVKKYGGIDPRNGWDTHIVLFDTIFDTAAVGFTNGAL